MAHMANIGADEFGSLLDAINDRAGDLRANGVTRVEARGVIIELAPPDPIIKIEGDDQRRGGSMGDELDPLDDPATFGGTLPERGRR